MANLDFDASSVEPAQPFDVIPAGKYICQIVQSEMRPTKDGGGSYLWLEMDVLDGEFAGRKLWDKLNLANANAQAVDIAKRQLSALAHACEKTFVRDSEELHLTPIVVTVRVKAAGPDKNGILRDTSNEIRGYAPVNGVAPVASAAPSRVVGSAPVAPAAKPAVPAWRTMKKA